jgi:hypothetical protein
MTFDSWQALSNKMQCSVHLFIGGGIRPGEAWGQLLPLLLCFGTICGSELDVSRSEVAQDKMMN